MIGQTISHYRILEKLGEGGMGVVYKAQDTKLDRIVALKFLPQHLTSDKTEQERFIHEAKAASALNHPNITTIYEVDDVDGTMFIAMELCEGKTLRQIVESQDLTVRKVLDIAVQTCEGLALAHEKGIVHRDIKSDNIMLTPRNQVKIMDFGLAKIKGSSKLTRTGSTLGTASYMSPEQAQGEEVDRRSDIFSFGIVLYELLTRQLPFRGEHQSAVTYAIVNEEPQPMARFNNQVSPRLEEIVAKALAKDRDERYQHIDDLLADLRRERKNLDYVKTSQAVPVSPIKEKRSTSRSLLLKFGLPAAAVVVLVVLMIIFNPFNLQVGQQKTVASEQNSVAVMYFENIPDPSDKDHTGEMLVNLLITSLSQAKGLDVVSRERLYEIQKDLNNAERTTIAPSLAAQIAQRAGVKTMLLGSIVQTTPLLVITSRLVDVQTGKILGSARLTGYSLQKIFVLVDSLSVLVKNELNVGVREAEPQQSVATVTTSSPEAYRSYITAIDMEGKYYYEEALAALERAVELDKTFAMAYFRMFQVKRDLSDRSGAIEALRKAYELTGKATERERLRISAEYLTTIQHDNAKAAQILEKYVGSYPHEADAVRNLAALYWSTFDLDRARAVLERGVADNPLEKELLNLYAYTLAGWGERSAALAMIDRYIALAPAEPNPYDSKGEVYFILGEVDSAVVWFQKALTMRRDFTSVEKIGWIAAIRGDYSAANAAFDQYASTSSQLQRFGASTDRVLIPILRGRFGEGRRVIEDLLVSREVQALPKQQTALLYGTLVFLCNESGDAAAALKYAQAYSDRMKKEPSNTVYVRDLLAWALQKNGNAKSAQNVLDQLGQDNPATNSREYMRFDYMRGVIAFEQGDYQGALAHFSPALQRQFRNRAPEYFYAVALLKSGRLSESIAELKRLSWWSPVSWSPVSLLDLPVMHNWPIASVKAHYWLGVAYEQQGNTNEAIKEYEIFLDKWKDAEQEWPEMKDAKVRLTRLKSGTA
jgi:eukaryotic-like serine/threonine-protein kinase